MMRHAKRRGELATQFALDLARLASQGDAADA
jgi:hypothetical protein